MAECGGVYLLLIVVESAEWRGRAEVVILWSYRIIPLTQARGSCRGSGGGSTTSASFDRMRRVLRGALLHRAIQTITKTGFFWGLSLVPLRIAEKNSIPWGRCSLQYLFVNAHGTSWHFMSLHGLFSWHSQGTVMTLSSAFMALDFNKGYLVYGTFMVLHGLPVHLIMRNHALSWASVPVLLLRMIFSWQAWDFLNTRESHYHDRWCHGSFHDSFM